MPDPNGKSQTRLIAVDFLAQVFLALSIGIAASIVLAGVVLLIAAEAQAAATELAPMKPAEARSGTLLLQSGAKGETLAAPLARTDVAIRVSGLLARARVRQTFHNPFDDWLEGIYVFPLPENSGVDHLKMRIGERVVEGEIRERAAAKKDYEQARHSGRRAALLEQERANIFTSSVANIGPREDVVVEIEYQQTLRYDAGQFSLRFPMVVGPRYIPGEKPVAGEPGTGWAGNTDRVSDAARITPPVARAQSGDAPINPVTIRVELDAGVPLAEVASPYHRVNLRLESERKQVVDLASGTTPANRDFELTWRPVPEAAPRAAWFTERRGSRTYGLLMLLPPAPGAADKRIPREAIFVIDTSGSMHGTSIAQAKEALALAIERLSAEDRFNVIEFNSYAKALFVEARAAGAENRAAALAWVQGLRAQGGTEMALALNLALNGGENPGRVRQVIFLTDGAVGNDEALIRLIGSKLGDSRLFTVGIGSAPNSHFMTQAARIGRGSFTYIGKIDEVRRKMGELFAKLESPVLKGVRIEWPEGAAVESWPKRIPDLYAGEPLLVTAALDRLQGSARVSGLHGDAPWEASVPLVQPAAGAGVGVLWARDKIGALMDAVREGASEEEARKHVVELALTHHLVTKYTSLVAIDRTPARPENAPLKTAALPTNLPEGWSYDAVFGAQGGELPQGATDSRANLLVGAILLLLATLLLLRQRAQRRRGWA